MSTTPSNACFWQRTREAGHRTFSALRASVRANGQKTLQSVSWEKVTVPTSSMTESMRHEGQSRPPSARRNGSGSAAARGMLDVCRSCAEGGHRQGLGDEVLALNGLVQARVIR